MKAGFGVSIRQPLTGIHFGIDGVASVLLAVTLLVVAVAVAGGGSLVYAPQPVENEGLLPLSRPLAYLFVVVLFGFVGWCIVRPVTSLIALVALVYPIFFLRYGYGLVWWFDSSPWVLDPFTGSTLELSIGNGIQLSTPQDLFVTVWALLAGPHFIRTVVPQPGRPSTSEVLVRVSYVAWVVGAVVSVLLSDQPDRSVTIFYTGFVAPLVLFAAIDRWIRAAVPDQRVERAGTILTMMCIGLGAAGVYAVFRTAHAYLVVFGALFDAIRWVRGGYLVSTVLALMVLAIAIVLRPMLSSVWLRRAVGLSILSLIVVILTGLSRTLYVSIPVLILSMLVFARAGRQLLVPLALAGSLVVGFGLSDVLTDRVRPVLDDSDMGEAIAEVFRNDRLLVAQPQITAFGEAPWFGVGLGAMASRYHADPTIDFYLDEVNHNLLLSVASEQGVVGLISLTAWMGALCYAFLWVRRHSMSAHAAAMAGAIVAGITAFAVQGLIGAGTIVSTGALQLQSNAYAFATITAVMLGLTTTAPRLRQRSRPLAPTARARS